MIMMGRLEKKYLWIQDILAWSNGKYKESNLNNMTMPELFKIHNKLYCKKMSKIYQ